MILLRCGGDGCHWLHRNYPHVNLHYLYVSEPHYDWIFYVGLTLTVLLFLFLVAHNLGLFLKRQTENQMHFIYQLYPWKTVNVKPSILEQTEEQAQRTAQELSVFYNCLVVVRYPDDRGIFCMAEDGELTELDTLKTLQFI